MENLREEGVLEVRRTVTFREALTCHITGSPELKSVIFENSANSGAIEGSKLKKISAVRLSPNT